jgi:hypothetical protein
VTPRRFSHEPGLEPGYLARCVDLVLARLLTRLDSAASSIISSHELWPACGNARADHEAREMTLVDLVGRVDGGGPPIVP